MRKERRERPQEMPIAVLGAGGFADFEDALNVIHKRPDIDHYVLVIPEIRELGAIVVRQVAEDHDGSKYYKDYVTVYSGDIEVTMPRGGGREFPGISVQAGGYEYPKSVSNIIVHVGDYYEDPVLDRGLVWMQVYDSKKPLVSFHVKKGEHSIEDLRDAYSRAVNGVTNYVGDILRGKNPEDSLS